MSRHQAEEHFEAVARQSLERAWGAALDASTSPDFRHDDGTLDEEVYLDVRKRWMATLLADVQVAHQRAVDAAMLRGRHRTW